MNIYWKLFTNTNNEDKTKKLINNFSKVVNSEYAEGGFVCSCSMPLLTTVWSNESVISGIENMQMSVETNA